MGLEVRRTDRDARCPRLPALFSLRSVGAVLALLVAVPANRLGASALAELFSRRRSCERISEALVRWARAA